MARGRDLNSDRKRERHLDESFRYCAGQVERHDSDRYATSLFAPPEERAGLHALYAFNLEIARTRERVSQPMIGQMRLQWWRDTLDGIYGGTPRRHEVASALAETIRRRALDRSLFDRLVDGREADLDETPPRTFSELSRYAEETSAPLVLLALQALGVREGAATDAARDIGIAWALVGIIRSIPFQAAARHRTMPDEVLRQAGASARDLMELRPHTELNQAVARVADVAREHLANARRFRADVPRRALPALLPATLAEGYLRLAHRCGYNPFNARLADPLPSRAFRLLMARLTGRY